MGTGVNKIIQFSDFREELGVETVYGQQIAHDFTRHTHRTLCIGMIEEGVRMFCCRKHKYEVIPGQVFIIPPDESHACSRKGQEFHSYQLLLVSSNIVHMILGNDKESSTLVVFKELVINDKKIFHQLCNLHVVLRSNEAHLVKQSLLLSTVGHLIENYANVNFDFARNSQQDEKIKQAQIFIEDNYAECFSLGDIAKIYHFNPFYFLRMFGQMVGVPPHIYQQQIRIRHAKHMLANGIPIVQVASNTGFVDQSHFTKVFKKMVGVTPGEYIKNYF